MDCFSTCPQISLSGAQDARFFIKRYSDANVQGYFKQQIEIYENREDVERWSELCKVDEEGSCTDLSQIRSGAQAEVFEEPCDVEWALAVGKDHVARHHDSAAVLLQLVDHNLLLTAALRGACERRDVTPRRRELELLELVALQILR